MNCGDFPASYCETIAKIFIVDKQCINQCCLLTQTQSRMIPHATSVNGWKTAVFKYLNLN